MSSKSKVGPVPQSKSRMKGTPEVDSDSDTERRAALKATADKQLEKNMDKLDGYERIGLPGELAHQPAPRVRRQEFDARAGVKTFEQLPKVTEETARAALLSSAPRNCCGSKAFLLTLPITKIDNTLAWHYGLESFVESRFTCWSYEPFVGQRIDGQENGRPPKPWDLELKPTKMFTDEDREVTVPHSASVKPCHHCNHTGRITCHKCKGKKTASCSGCMGQGKKMQTQGAVPRKVICSECDGHGKKRCATCNGSGDEECSTCKGQQKLVITVKVKCEWRRKDSDFIEEKTAMPDELVRFVTGKMIFDEEAESVSPITNFPLRAVNESSKQLITAHEKNYSGQRLIRQRHYLRGVPVAECQYSHNGKDGAFYIYGFEHKVFAEGLPSGGCSIL